MNNTNRLAALAADIRRDHQDLEGSLIRAAANAVYIGRALNEAKALLQHGQWQSWLQENCGLSQRSARRYMQLANSGMEPATVADLGVKAASASLSKVSRRRDAPWTADEEANYQEWFGELRGLLEKESPARRDQFLAETKRQAALQAVVEIAHRHIPDQKLTEFCALLSLDEETKSLAIALRVYAKAKAE